MNDFNEDYAKQNVVHRTKLLSTRPGTRMDIHLVS